MTDFLVPRAGIFISFRISSQSTAIARSRSFSMLCDSLMVRLSSLMYAMTHRSESVSESASGINTQARKAMVCPGQTAWG
jgi:hypothetical protein